MDDADVQIDRCALQVVAGEIGAVVDVEDVGDAAHGPARVGRSPDRLSQCEGSVHGRGRPGENGVSADGACVVVHNDGEPGPVRFPVKADDEDVEFGVVGLPSAIRVISAAPEDEFVVVSI